MLRRLVFLPVCLLACSVAFGGEGKRELFLVTTVAQTVAHLDSSLSLSEALTLYYQALVLMTEKIGFSSLCKANGYSEDLFGQVIWQTSSALELYDCGIPPDKIRMAIYMAQARGVAPRSGGALLFVALDGLGQCKDRDTKQEILKLDGMLEESCVLHKAGVFSFAPFVAGGVDLQSIPDATISDSLFRRTDGAKLTGDEFKGFIRIKN